MHVSFLLASLGFLASTTAAIAGGNATMTGFKHFDCGTDSAAAKAEFLETIRSLHSDSNVGSPGARARAVALKARQAGPITVDAYFHVVSTAARDGQITQEMADHQAAAMNQAYNPYNIFFNVVKTTFTVNDAWAVGAGADDTAMKTALRAGTYAALNIYFQTDLTGNSLGTCTLPSSIDGPIDPSLYVSDGCNINAHTMPGGTVQGYNKGMTAVHETGHWMGLLHTFEGYACEGDGDFIADTPMESVSTDGCPVNPRKDSCPGDAEGDPIHNYMDYSTDECYEGFTPLQQERMQTMWGMYRVGK